MLMSRRKIPVQFVDFDGWILKYHRVNKLIYPQIIPHRQIFDRSLPAGGKVAATSRQGDWMNMEISGIP